MYRGCRGEGVSNSLTPSKHMLDLKYKVHEFRNKENVFEYTYMGCYNES